MYKNVYRDCIVIKYSIETLNWNIKLFQKILHLKMLLKIFLLFFAVLIIHEYMKLILWWYLNGTLTALIIQD